MNSNVTGELRWALLFFLIFVVLMLTAGSALKAHGVPPFISDVFIGMASALGYVITRNAIARRKRLSNSRQE